MKRGSRLAWAFAVSLVVLVLVLVGVELGFRALLGEPARGGLENYRRYLLTGMMRGYEPRAYTVYQRPRKSPDGNAFGFNDRAWTRARTPGVPRIVCMGGSTTEGGNPSGRQGSYPTLLERVLEERTGRDFEVLNAGIAGWTSAEMLCAWFLTMQDLAPDVLVLHEGVNDLEPRFMAAFEPDYSHWRRSIQTWPVTGLERQLVRWSRLYAYFRLRDGKAPEILDVSTDRSGPKEPLIAEGKLPFETSLAFRRNLRNIALSAQGAGTTVVLMTMPTGPNVVIGAFWRHGIQQNNQHLRELSAEHGFLLADAARAFEGRPELAQEFIDLVHLEVAGNRAKAELVAEVLAGWVAALPPEGARPPVH
jgi:lysophospholipase L1-like esterase